MTDQQIDRSTSKKKRAIIGDKRMINMLDERQHQINTMQEAQHRKQVVEDDIITTLLRDNDQRCITVNWNKLYRLAGWGRDTQ